LFETVTLLEIFRRRSWIKNEQFAFLKNKAAQLGKRISSLIDSIKIFNNSFELRTMSFEQFEQHVSVSDPSIKIPQKTLPSILRLRRSHPTHRPSRDSPSEKINPTTFKFPYFFESYN
jgi:hypothetical protein